VRVGVEAELLEQPALRQNVVGQIDVKEAWKDVRMPLNQVEVVAVALGKLDLGTLEHLVAVSTNSGSRYGQNSSRQRRVLLKYGRLRQ